MNKCNFISFNVSFLLLNTYNLTTTLVLFMNVWNKLKIYQSTLRLMPIKWLANWVTIKKNKSCFSRIFILFWGHWCLLKKNIDFAAWLIILLLPGMRSEVQWLVWCITAAISRNILWFRRRTGHVASISRIHMWPLSFSPSWIYRWVVIWCLLGGSVVVVPPTRLVLMAWHMPSGLHHTTHWQINLKKTALAKTNVGY